MKKIKGILLVYLFMFLIIGCSSGIKVTVKENVEIEYGAKIDDVLLFDKEQSDEDVKVKEVKDFDNKKVGEQEITVIFTNEAEKTKEEKVKVTVKDTRKPEIKLKKDKVEITESDQFDPASNIESVKDPVDGDIKKSDDKKLTKNGYLISSDVDNKKAGNYTVKITAYDANGNKAESSYKVTVKEKPQEPAPVATQPSNQTSGYSSSYSNNTGSTSNSGASASTGNAASNSGSSAPSTTGNASSGEISNQPHVHDGPAVEGMYFDTCDELDAWVFSDECPYTGAYGVFKCSCGKFYIDEFY